MEMTAGSVQFHAGPPGDSLVTAGTSGAADAGLALSTGKDTYR